MERHAYQPYPPGAVNSGSCIRCGRIPGHPIHKEAPVAAAPEPVVRPVVEPVVLTPGNGVPVKEPVPTEHLAIRRMKEALRADLS